MFWNPCYKEYKFCYMHIFIFDLYFNPRKRKNKLALFVLGVLLSNCLWFLVWLCLTVLLVSGKILKPIWHHYLGQRIKVPKSTSFANLFVLVEIIKFCVWNFFHDHMLLNFAVSHVWEIFDLFNYFFDLMLIK